MSLKARLDRIERLLPPPAQEFDLDAFFQEQRALAEGKEVPAEPIDAEAFERWQAEMESYKVDEFSFRPDAINERINKRKNELAKLAPQPEPEPVIRMRQ